MTLRSIMTATVALTVLCAASGCIADGPEEGIYEDGDELQDGFESEGDNVGEVSQALASGARKLCIKSADKSSAKTDDWIKLRTTNSDGTKVWSCSFQGIGRDDKKCCTDTSADTASPAKRAEFIRVTTFKTSAMTDRNYGNDGLRVTKVWRESPSSEKHKSLFRRDNDGVKLSSWVGACGTNSEYDDFWIDNDGNGNCGSAYLPFYGDGSTCSRKVYCTDGHY